MSKIRVYELSKNVGLSNKALMTLLEDEFNLVLKSHSSTIEDNIAEQIVQRLSQKAASPATPVKVEVEPPAASEPASKQAVKPTPTISSPTPEKAAEKKPMPAPTPVAQPSSAAPSTAPAEKRPAPQQIKPQQPQASAPESRLPQPAQQPVSPSQPAATIKPPAPAAPRTPSTETRGSGFSKKEKDALPEAPKVVRITEQLTVKDLAQLLGVRETEVIRHVFMKGTMVTLNQTLEPEFAKGIATEMGFEVEAVEKEVEAEAEYSSTTAIEKKETLDSKQFKNLTHRAPVVSIMGHVDHGKTSLLDAIREARLNIVDSEAGGITQRIGAYSVEKDGQRIVFLDTPGHEAFTAMRMRGANATDIAILVVAADDGVMPQTIEAINHAKAAGLPIIVAVNKIDKEDADPDRVLTQLSDYGLVSEKWGGETVTVEVSALLKLGLDDLLEMINLVSELQNLKADATVPATGVIIESQLDKRKGPVATALVQNGTLKVGDSILIGPVGGRIRALISDRGERLKEAGPSTPVEILGLSDVPQAGVQFEVIRDDKRFKQQLNNAQLAEREKKLVNRPKAQGLTRYQDDQTQDQAISLNFIIKADTQGSAEAVTDAVLGVSETEEAKLKVLHSGTGDISEADVMLASTSGAIIIGFNVREDGNAARLAEAEGVVIKKYDVIYHINEDIERIVLGKLAPETKEVEIGTVEVRQLFTVGKNKVIAGCMVTAGKVVRNAKVVVTRGKETLFTGIVDNLKRFRDDAKEVAAGYECGISFDKFNDLQIGDTLTIFTEEELERTSLKPLASNASDKDKLATSYGKPS